MKTRDVMQTRVVTIAQDATVNTAVRLMLQHHISGLPVVDTAGKLAGILTEGDLLRRAEIGTEHKHRRWAEFLLGPGRLADEYRQSHTRRVSDVMTDRVVSIDEQADLAAAVGLMEKNRVKRLPVLRDGKVVGIVSRADLLRALVHRVHGMKPAPASDSAIRDGIIAEMARQTWSAANSANVVVHDGIVELHGAVLDERERAALRVIAENVPGVKKVEDHLFWIDVVTGMAYSPSGATG